MARAYKVESACGAVRYAKSVAHARELREELMEKLNCRKKDISIDEEVEIPTKKDELIDFLNELLEGYDGEGGEEEEEEEEEEED